MPVVNFVGEIVASFVDAPEVSVTWAIVPGNSAWYLKRGVGSGETHTCETSSTCGKATICHPIDCQYTTSSSEGWPLFVCEVSTVYGCMFYFLILNKILQYLYM